MTKKTDSQLVTSNNTAFTNNGTGAITGYALNTFFQDLIDSKLSNGDSTVFGKMTFDTGAQVLIDDSVTAVGTNLPLSFDGDTDTGLYRNAANQFRAAAGGVDILTFQQGTLTGMRMSKPIYMVFGSSIAAAASMDIGVASGNTVNISGAGATITTFGTNAIQGMHLWLKWAGVNTITNNANILCPGGANITTAANDKTLVVYNGSGIWEIYDYRRFATAP